MVSEGLWEEEKVKLRCDDSRVSNKAKDKARWDRRSLQEEEAWCEVVQL